MSCVDVRVVVSPPTLFSFFFLFSFFLLLCTDRHDRRDRRDGRLFRSSTETEAEPEAKGQRQSQRQSLGEKSVLLLLMRDDV